MPIGMSLIAVIQNEPRDGDIAYLEKNEEAFKARLTELGMEERDTGSEVVELGYTYVNEDDFCTVIGHEVQFPYPISNVCLSCFRREDSGYQVHKVGDSMVVNFVSKTDCENGHKEE